MRLPLCRNSGVAVCAEVVPTTVFLRAKAEKGDAEAQHSHALSYLFGMGIPTDITQAVCWLGKSAQQGSAIRDSRAVGSILTLAVR